MVGKGKTRLLILVAAVAAAFSQLSAQNNSEQADSLVRLISAKFIEQQETPKGLVRKALAATFLHNGTYLISDSSMWYMDSSVIKCIGNVRMLQGETELTSEKLDYLINEDLAQFRGAVVQLRNKQDNILRTRNLDYNTRDSLAIFSGGASMISGNGQIIESDDGRYFSPDELFFFEGNVNMFTDSVFVKTSSLEYDSNAEKAWFTSYIDFWNEDNMLSADGGWYESKPDIFFFSGNVHALSQDQESWSDSLYYYRTPGDVLMLGSAQIQDSTRNVAAVSDYLFYEDSLARVTLRKEAAVALWAENEEGQIDTTYFGADTLIYHTVRYCDIPEQEISLSKERLETILSDPVSDYRRRAAAEAAEEKEREEREKNASSNRMSQAAKANADGKPQDSAEQPAESVSDSLSAATDSLAVSDSLAAGADSLASAVDSLAAASDSLYTVSDSLSVSADSLVTAVDSLYAVSDSLSAGADSLAVPLDTTRIGYLTGIGNVRIFRYDMQVRSDSVSFCELDSLARFYKSPVIWNEGNRQYSSDSLFVLVKNNAVDRASLMSNAFIAVEEDTIHYDQIKSSEVMAYFDSDAALKRFDALGGVSALFYLEENDEIATVNKVESTMLSATFRDGELETVYYFESPKSDAYPVVQLPPADSRMKGFNWQAEMRPKGPKDITSLEIRTSERSHYEAIERPRFVQTERFFSGYMDDLYSRLEEAARRKRLAEQKRQQEEAAAEAAADSLETADSLALAADSLAFADSLRTAVDSLSQADSLAASGSEEEYMSERELRRAMRIARRDARWAELDARDAAKSAAKAERMEERQRRKEERKARIRARQAERDARLLQKYIERYEKQKEKNEREQKSESTGERAPGIEERGSVSAAPET